MGWVYGEGFQVSYSTSCCPWLSALWHTAEQLQSSGPDAMPPEHLVLIMAKFANMYLTSEPVTRRPLPPPNNPTLAEQNAAAAALAPEFEAITAALTSATTTLAKRALSGNLALTARGGTCPKDCLLIKVQLLVYEIACTLKFVIAKLGLACVLRNLTPLLLALVGLIKALDKVVAGILILVKALLSTALGIVAKLLLDLIF
ncbi:hypothetical protein VTI74DRAFT_10600 [Chaetomium olivicolor]